MNTDPRLILTPLQTWLSLGSTALVVCGIAYWSQRSQPLIDKLRARWLVRNWWRRLELPRGK